MQPTRFLRATILHKLNSIWRLWQGWPPFGWYARENQKETNWLCWEASSQAGYFGLQTKKVPAPDPANTPKNAACAVRPELGAVHDVARIELAQIWGRAPTSARRDVKDSRIGPRSESWWQLPFLHFNLDILKLLSKLANSPPAHPKDLRSSSSMDWPLFGLPFKGLGPDLLRKTLTQELPGWATWAPTA